MAPEYFLLASLKRPKAGGIRYHKDARSVLNRAQWSYVWARQGGGAGPIVLVPGGLRRRAGVAATWSAPIEKWAKERGSGCKSKHCSVGWARHRKVV